MNTFERTSRRLVEVMYYIAGAAITVMMLLTCADVILRFCTTLYVKFEWDVIASLRPIPGTYEMVCLLGVVAAAFAMAHTSLQAGHVAVNFVVRLLSEKTQAIFEIVTGSIGFIFFAIVCWQSVEYALRAKAWGEVSMTLQLPYYPFILGIALSAFTVCLVLFFAVANECAKVLKK
ncbi:MAG: TRAP transporter small permease [Deltaproteobacteria bacterium]|nr:TRAP transporter small permease [Deltaproteobacteria bacterium]